MQDFFLGTSYFSYSPLCQDPEDNEQPENYLDHFDVTLLEFGPGWMMVRPASAGGIPKKKVLNRKGKNSWPQNAANNSDVYEFVSLRIMGSQSR